MERILQFLTILLFVVSCSPRLQKQATVCFEGKLVKRGICGQRVVELISPDKETLSIAGEWTDSLSNKHYRNVFTVSNPCDFPATIQEGDTFKFAVSANPGTGCITCYAYIATPKEHNPVRVNCTP